MFWQQWKLQHIQHQEHKFVQGTSTWKLTGTAGKCDLHTHTKTLLTTMPQHMEIKKKMVLFSYSLVMKILICSCRKLFWIIIHLATAYNFFPWIQQIGMERGKWIYSWVCLLILLNPQVWCLDYFFPNSKSIHRIQNQ